ncbi:hypothetical protein HanIR_Chr11g0522701 [Helianthus annuus]|nr:hypothetical protein HanIR_Chr11g0522701 [Helianthus annuus]
MYVRLQGLSGKLGWMVKQVLDFIIPTEANCQSLNQKPQIPAY